MSTRPLPRREFLRRAAGAAAGLALPTIVPSRVLGANGQTPPSQVIRRAVIGCGGRGNAFVLHNERGAREACVAVCDVDANRLAAAAMRAGAPAVPHADYREVMDRTDVDVVYIATPPHWHALITMHAAESGKDVYCEKPFTHFIHEGRAAVEAVDRHARVFQVGTFGRFGGDAARLWKVFRSGLLGDEVLLRMDPCLYNYKVKEWSGRIGVPPEPVPRELDWNMWLGPAPFKPFFRHRCHGSFRGYWDYDGGGFSDMAAHFLDPIVYYTGNDQSGPAEVWAEAPWPVDSDAVGLWGRIWLRFADGLTIRCTSGEWGDFPDEVAAGAAFIEGDKAKIYRDGHCEPEDLYARADREVPDPPRLVPFDEAIWTRERAGGHTEAAHRTATLLHLGNLAIRLGRKLRWDPAAERFLDDDEANRLVDLPMRAPWHL